jgi:hypothetical protein
LVPIVFLIILCCHVTLENLAYSLVYRWPEDDREKEWIVAQKMCLEAMEGVHDPEQARAVFVAAAKAAGMLMAREEYIQSRSARRSRKPGQLPAPH